MELQASVRQEYPQAEVREYESCYLFHFALGPLQRDDLRLKIVDNELELTGEKPANEAFAASKFSFVFPRVIDAELARAVFAKGAIQVLVPKRKYSKERMIQIESAKTGFWIRLFGGQSWRHYSDNLLADPVPIGFTFPENHEERSECL